MIHRAVRRVDGARVNVQLRSRGLGFQCLMKCSFMCCEGEVMDRGWWWMVPKVNEARGEETGPPK